MLNSKIVKYSGVAEPVVETMTEITIADLLATEMETETETEEKVNWLIRI